MEVQATKKSKTEIKLKHGSHLSQEEIKDGYQVKAGKLISTKVEPI